MKLVFAALLLCSCAHADIAGSFFADQTLGSVTFTSGMPKFVTTGYENLGSYSLTLDALTGAFTASFAALKAPTIDPHGVPGLTYAEIVGTNISGFAPLGATEWDTESVIVLHWAFADDPTWYGTFVLGALHFRAHPAGALSPVSGIFTAVPEPATISLVALGILTLISGSKVRQKP